MGCHCSKGFLLLVWVVPIALIVFMMPGLLLYFLGYQPAANQVQNNCFIDDVRKRIQIQTSFQKKLFGYFRYVIFFRFLNFAMNVNKI